MRRKFFLCPRLAASFCERGRRQRSQKLAAKRGQRRSPLSSMTSVLPVMRRPSWIIVSAALTTIGWLTPVTIVSTVSVAVMVFDARRLQRRRKGAHAVGQRRVRRQAGSSVRAGEVNRAGVVRRHVAEGIEGHNREGERRPARGSSRSADLEARRRRGADQDSGACSFPSGCWPSVAVIVWLPAVRSVAIAVNVPTPFASASRASAV